MWSFVSRVLSRLKTSHIVIQVVEVGNTAIRSDHERVPGSFVTRHLVAPG